MSQNAAKNLHRIENIATPTLGILSLTTDPGLTKPKAKEKDRIGVRRVEEEVEEGYRCQLMTLTELHQETELNEINGRSRMRITDSTRRTLKMSDPEN